MKSSIESMIEYICQTDYLANIGELLGKNPQNFTTVWTFIVEIFQRVMVPLGSCFFVIYFLIALYEKTTSDSLNFEQLIKMLVKLLIAMAIVTNCMDIVKCLMDVGKIFIDNINATIAVDGSTMAVDLKNIASLETNDYKDILASLVFLVKLLIPYVITFAISLFIRVQCYVRLLEIMIYTLCAPVGVADIFSEGVHGAGWRYLKNFLAVCLQGGIILCISAIFSRIAGETVISGPDFMTYISMYLIMGISTCLMIGKSKNIAKELLGV